MRLLAFPQWRNLSPPTVMMNECFFPPRPRLSLKLLSGTLLPPLLEKITWLFAACFVCHSVKRQSGRLIKRDAAAGFSAWCSYLWLCWGLSWKHKTFVDDDDTEGRNLCYKYSPSSVDFLQQRFPTLFVSPVR